MAGRLIAGSDIRGCLRRVTAPHGIAAKSNEIRAFVPLLADIADEHLRGAVVTMDALHVPSAVTPPTSSSSATRTTW